MLQEVMVTYYMLHIKSIRISDTLNMQNLQFALQYKQISLGQQISICSINSYLKYGIKYYQQKQHPRPNKKNNAKNSLSGTSSQTQKLQYLIIITIVNKPGKQNKAKTSLYRY